MEKEDSWSVRLTPLQKVQAHSPHDRLTRQIPHVRLVLDLEVGCTVEEACELGGPRHVKGRQRVSKLIEEHESSLKRTNPLVLGSGLGSHVLLIDF
jgi:hypothetical protein